MHSPSILDQLSKGPESDLPLGQGARVLQHVHHDGAKVIDAVLHLLPRHLCQLSYGRHNVDDNTRVGVGLLQLWNQNLHNKCNDLYYFMHSS